MSKIIAYAFLCIGLVCCLISAHARVYANSITEPDSLADIDTTSAVILAYHRIGEDYVPDENLRTEQFQEQINTIISGNYSVLPLSTIIDSFENKTPLPPKSLAITFDGGFKSVLRNAVPLLLEHNLPFTIFFASDLASSNNPLFINWDDIDTLARNDLVTLGVHPSSYARLHDMPGSEMQAQLNKAKIAFRARFDREPDFYAYPFGEYNQNYITAIKNQGYHAAFGLNSGVAHREQDLLTLPRFSLTEKYGDPDHFKLIINARPLPVSRMEPVVTSTLLTTPPIGFTIHPQLRNQINRLSCFASDQPPPEIQIMGNARVEIRLKNELQPHSKTRINCTIPIPSDESGTYDNTTSWRWTGMILTYDGASPSTQEEKQPAKMMLNPPKQGEPL